MALPKRIIKGKKYDTGLKKSGEKLYLELGHKLLTGRPVYMICTNYRKILGVETKDVIYRSSSKTGAIKGARKIAK